MRKNDDATSQPSAKSGLLIEGTSEAGQLFMCVTLKKRVSQIPQYLPVSFLPERRSKSPILPTTAAKIICQPDDRKVFCLLQSLRDTARVVVFKIAKCSNKIPCLI